MAIVRNSTTGSTVYSIITRYGKTKALSEGNLGITGFYLMDYDMNYQNLNPNNVDENDPDMLAQAILEPQTNDLSSLYDTSDGIAKGFVLHNPFFVKNEVILSGNKLTDNPLYAPNQEFIIPMDSLSGTDIFAPATSITGSIINSNVYYNINVFAADQNGSVLNGTIISLYRNNAFVESKTLVDNTQTYFSNLSANQTYKVIASNVAYKFKESISGSPSWFTQSLKNNEKVAFVGTPISVTASSFAVSGTVTNLLTAAPVGSLRVNVHFMNQTLTANTNGSGIYSFSVSAGSQYVVSLDTTNYIYDPFSTSLTGVLTANAVHNIGVKPTSYFAGNLYYYNTTTPISNAIINLYSGLSAALTNTYISSFATDSNGGFRFDNIEIQKDYNLLGSLNKYTFVNTPYNIAASAYTATLSAIVLYAKKEERPFIFDSPFPYRRRIGVTMDNNVLPVFYDPCSWILYTSKFATLGYSTNFNYSPIYHQDVLRSSNYLDLIRTIEGPYEFHWNSQKKYTDNFNNNSATTYISDSYLVKIALYALPYKYSQSEFNPQWDQFSFTDDQIIFPQQINNKISDLKFGVGDKVSYIDLSPQLENQQLAVNLKDVNKLQSLLPRQQVNVPVTVNTSNSIPDLGLLLAQGFNIDSSILQVGITPYDLSQNPDYAAYASIQGTEKRVLVQVQVDDFEERSVEGFEDGIIATTSYDILNTPLPIFTYGDTTIQSNVYANNMRFAFDFNGLIDLIRGAGFVFNRVIQWSLDGVDYTPEREFPYITISTFGASKSTNQLMFTVDGTHYKISDEFKQFIISYLGIDINDVQTVNSVINNNALVDWIFYIFVIQYGVYRNAYTTGQLQPLLSIRKEAKYAILMDLILKGKSQTEVITDVTNRQYLPSDSANLFISSFGNNVTGTQQTATVSTVQPNSPNAQFTNINGVVAQSPISAVGNINNTIGSAVASNPNNNQAVNPNINNGTRPVVTGGQTPQPFQVQMETVPQLLINDYVRVMKIFVESWKRFDINIILSDIYGFVTFDYTKKYRIIIKTFGRKLVTNVVKVPIKRLTVLTESITPIITRMVRITNANNYFNLHSELEKKLRMSIKFDLSRTETQDNLLKMINYLNDRLYTIYLGVEIVDDGQITSTYNNEVLTLSKYVNASEEIRNKLCKSDKQMWLIPMTVGGIKQMSTGLSVSDPSTFKGNASVRGIVVKNSVGTGFGGVDTAENVKYLIRVIRLTESGNVQVVNADQIYANDFIAFDVVRISSAADATYTSQIPRFLQYLAKYDYNRMNLDITELRNVFAKQYSSIPGIAYVGSFGPAFASSTMGPNIWDTRIIDWPTGVSAITILQKLFAEKATQVFSVGQMVDDINQFKIS